MLDLTESWNKSGAWFYLHRIFYFHAFLSFGFAIFMPCSSIPCRTGINPHEKQAYFRCKFANLPIMPLCFNTLVLLEFAAPPLSDVMHATFTTIALDLFDEEDRENSYNIAMNRKGQKEGFPLLSTAISVVPTDQAKICHSGKISDLAAELKVVAKKSGKSCYVLVRGKNSRKVYHERAARRANNEVFGTDSRGQSADANDT